MKNVSIKILLVDNEPDILEVVGYNLKNEGYQIFTAKNGAEGLEQAKLHKPHLILLDVMMPEIDGIETCEKIRSEKDLKNVMIAFFTARGEDYSQLAGFDAGADDYITKPVKPKVLIGKVKSLLRRLPHVDSTAAKQIGDIVIDSDAYTVLKEDVQIDLPKKEFELFSLLASNPGKIFKREIILDKIWGNEVVVGGRTIDVHIRKLREKIGDHYIKTIKGVGYKFATEDDV